MDCPDEKPARHVAREPNGAYRISAGLVHGLILTIFTSLLGIAGYMVAWAVNESAWRSGIDSKLTADRLWIEQNAKAVASITQLADEVAQQDRLLAPGILPRAEERIRALEQEQAKLRGQIEFLWQMPEHRSDARKSR